MSRKNGDKARFGKEQQKKLLRRQRNLALRQSLASNVVAPGPAAEAAPPNTTAETKEITDVIL